MGKSRTSMLVLALAVFSDIGAQVETSGSLPAMPVATGQVQVLINAARARTRIGETYDPSYVVIAYPGGDVPADRGVCTDVVIRAYRAIDIDLQVLVHEDMRTHFARYPALWGLERPDRNIDHRRVPNLETWFRRQGAALPPSRTAADYRPGDVVSWRLPGNLPHIGIVSDRDSAEGTPLILHNIGAGSTEEDVLFAWPVVGHFRYLPGDS
ncbi:DUF1287 domain-containing protein [Xanthomonadaceae bacterium JHOS43]|nr:DUF1287 domain-containing protein [Xanthomonadaceae bacterium JHOS43]MCX7564427.1 DUF1287 domain-containing protein [Xanthomonadaceae bacterium XH05]